MKIRCGNLEGCMCVYVLLLVAEPERCDDEKQGQLFVRRKLGMQDNTIINATLNCKSLQSQYATPVG